MKNYASWSKLETSEATRRLIKPNWSDLNAMKVVVRGRIWQGNEVSIIHVI